MRMRKSWIAAALTFCVVPSVAPAGVAAPAPPAKIIARIDLSKPFHLPPGASFTATQAPDVQDPNGNPGDRMPGSIHLCIRAAVSAQCSPDLDDALGYEKDNSPVSHFLQTARVVYPRGAKAAPLLHLQVGSLYATNGSQGHAGIILAYRPVKLRFEQVLRQVFGGNMNQEARYIESGPLKGGMITVHPTDNAPFSYWVTVHRLTSDYRYKQVLRYRSATHYGDGNPLAVIDSEMPNILSRLGLWRPGQPLPLPAGHCSRPHLVKTELWCS